ncbi:MAG TPA: hypothetical protein VMU43_07550 [Candidatus Acidoferrum sp.]|nr:hypothetical protein [Candidatus Acidoferrum sp.]
MNGKTMSAKEQHLIDEELLRMASGELSKRRRAEVRAHLECCWTCRERREEIEKTIQGFVAASREELDTALPPIEGPRALLRAQLADLAQRGRPERRGFLQFAASWREAAAALALALATFGGVWLHMQKESRSQMQESRVRQVETLPKSHLTPGLARRVSLAQICAEPHDEVQRSVSRGMQEEVFKEYGIAGAPPANYEVDYLITPGLGGADDIRNLWPEPHYDTKWNSYVKDQLEDQLHEMVCNGKVSLATAQQDISKNWIDAYKKYFHTDQPLAVHSTRQGMETSPSMILLRRTRTHLDLLISSRMCMFEAPAVAVWPPCLRQTGGGETQNDNLRCCERRATPTEPLEI